MQAAMNSSVNCRMRHRSSTLSPVRDVADPIVREVGSDEDQVACAESPDVVAHVTVALGRRDEVQLVLGVEMPPDRSVRIAVRPDLEGLVAADLHQFEIWFHSSPPGLRAVSALPSRT